MISTTTQSILLLTSYFSKTEGGAKPLTPTEWGRFALWLNEQGKTPADLLTSERSEVLQGWQDSKISMERLEQLLDRGHALALALERWSRVGIWVLTRSDADYPKQLKYHLRNSAPPVLFGCGNARLLNLVGISVVGARDASTPDLDYAKALGQQIAFAGQLVVSGGARGVDEAAMLGGLIHGGVVIGVMADSLLQAAMASKWRQGLMSNNLVLVSPFYPEAGFNRANAMARNKYIYCLSRAAIVVRSDTKGGTWSGAIENLKKRWVPLWVRRDQDALSGHRMLVAEGGQWLDGQAEQLDVQALYVSQKTTMPQVFEGEVLFREDEPFSLSTTGAEIVMPTSSVAPLPMGNSEVSVEGGLSIAELSFYHFFLEKLKHIGRAVTIDEMVTQWELPKRQIRDWLKKSIDELVVEELPKPARFQYLKTSSSECQPSSMSAKVSPSQMGLGLD